MSDPKSLPPAGGNSAPAAEEKKQEKKSGWLRLAIETVGGLLIAVLGYGAYRANDARIDHKDVSSELGKRVQQLEADKEKAESKLAAAEGANKQFLELVGKISPPTSGADRKVEDKKPEDSGKKPPVEDKPATPGTGEPKPPEPTDVTKSLEELKKLAEAGDKQAEDLGKKLLADTKLVKEQQLEVLKALVTLARHERVLKGNPSTSESLASFIYASKDADAGLKYEALMIRGEAKEGQGRVKDAILDYKAAKALKSGGK